MIKKIVITIGAYNLSWKIGDFISILILKKNNQGIQLT